MSGGSFDYLYSKDLGSLIEEPYLVESMYDRLQEIPQAKETLKKTEELLQKIQDIRNFYKENEGEFYRVWKAIEWYDSHDTGEEDMLKEIENYNK